MKILFDDNMPFAEQCFSPFGNAYAFNAKTLQPDELTDVDALLVRSTLSVNAELLSAAKQLKFVATATAGFNHLDTEYLAAAKIPWYAAAGCNATAVAEYVISALLNIVSQFSSPIQALQHKSVGIIGAGNVGTALATKLSALDIHYLLSDPPLEAQGDARDFSPLDELLRCDIICLHVPYTETGKYPTQHLLGHKELSQLNDSQVVINGCRGGVLDEQAYLTLAQQQSVPALILDAWEHEPAINQQLLAKVAIGTPHIAGHSIEGKARGTFMVYDKLCKLASREPGLSMHQVLDRLDALALSSAMLDDPKIISKLVFSLYDCRDDDRLLRQAMAQSGSVEEAFTGLRQNYRIRREFSAQTISIPQHSIDSQVATQLSQLGFNIQVS